MKLSVFLGKDHINLTDSERGLQYLSILDYTIYDPSCASVAGWLVGWSVIFFFKGRREATLPCSYLSKCFLLTYLICFVNFFETNCHKI